MPGTRTAVQFSALNSPTIPPDASTHTIKINPVRDRDLYVFVIDMNGTVQAHGAKPKLIDKNLSLLKDADDKLFIKTMIDIARSKGKGWVDYKWPNPLSKSIEPKSTYVEKIDEVFIGCGIYK